MSPYTRSMIVSNTDLNQATERMLVLSTGHLPAAEYEKISRGRDLMGPDAPRFISHAYGTIVTVSSDDDVLADWATTLAKAELDTLMKIVRLAHDNGIQWLNFDQDGPYVDGLEQFDW